eukprot:CAMPEP_0203815954 /NCGR_PEP_ID=MMETSP0115-20131106/13647_1 /ASSEMBLY_ACC=CAM_ASM_000227 /TAXON_ID=33651 /ORGANISM="Bicosoecid sp, Strain ms1" /LENGTH=43 /DNA_ID= /DNA_START= /DNA_END= /DNA_ORIENTATION=
MASPASSVRHAYSLRPRQGENAPKNYAAAQRGLAVTPRAARRK